MLFCYQILTFNLPTKNDIPTGFPSSEYVDLTLNISGSTYIAPANGWLFFSKGATAANQEVYIADINERFAWEDICPVSGQYCQITVPWKKGHAYKVVYGLAGTTVAFRFIYDEGQPSIIKY